MRSHFCAVHTPIHVRILKRNFKEQKQVIFQSDFWFLSASLVLRIVGALLMLGTIQCSYS